MAQEIFGCEVNDEREPEFPIEETPQSTNIQEEEEDGDIESK